jgi:dihydroxy-acid dehydratase
MRYLHFHEEQPRRDQPFANEAVETTGQEVVCPLGQPLKKNGGLVILHGSLAPEGSVMKISGTERMQRPSADSSPICDRQTNRFGVSSALTPATSAASQSPCSIA